MRFFYILIFLLLSLSLKAQPFNDNCGNAGVINIPNGGWDYGIFSSDTVDLTSSTLQGGEFIPVQQVARAKTVWYKFSLPTTREVIITMLQPGVAPFSLPATAAGWTLYRTNTCFPTIAEVVDPPIINIEGYTHRCLRKGDYYIQVSATLAANDSIFIQLQTGPSSATEILYDHASQPLNFGLISGLYPAGATNQFYETGCQSMFQGEVPCPNATYTQSTWHTFTTDNFIDFYRFELAESPWVLPNSPARTFGYRLYKGNCMLDSIADGTPAGGSNLTEIVPCSTLTQTYSTTYAADFAKCLLEPNTTYSIQLFFPEDYSRQINVRMYETGGGEEISEDPDNIAPTHQLGTLPFGVNSSSDFLTCEGLLSNWTACNSMVPASGYYLYAGDTFDLASYRTFTISTTTNVQIDDIITNQPGLLFRLYSGDVTSAGCSGLTFYEQFYGAKWLYCLPAGQYTLQILGRSEIQNIFTYWRSNLGKQHSVSINVAQYYSSAFGLHTASEIDNINSGNPLVNGSQYYATWDTFDCQLTYLPDGNVCSNAYENNNRVIYRKINIDQSGILVVGGGVWYRYNYRLYRGDASTAPISGNRLQGLVDQAGCQNTYYPFKVCVTPGIYTLAVFGDSSDVGYADREWFKFYTYPPTAYTTPATAELLDSVTLTRTTVNATPTRFSCLDNPSTILGNTPCSGATKLIYREVYFAQPSLMQFTPSLTSLNGNSPTVYYRFFTGRISDGSISSLYRNCATSFNDCIPTGWYTIVAYGFGDTYVDPDYPSGYGGNIGDLSGFTITIDPRVQKFRTIALSENANAGNPMNWYLHSSGGSTPKYPRNDTTYTLATEFWDCANDLPLDPGITTCIGSNNRVSYRVFTLGKPSYLYIYNLNPYPYGYQSRLYAGDLRLQTPPFTITQECITDQMRICASPGTYTLVTFAGDNHIGYTHTPQIYIDSLGTSKFDYAAQAYNFGDIPNDNTQYLGNPIDPPGPLGRAASNDFFFCSTGASATDPNNNCPIGTNPPGNALPAPTNPRRNLWYTFTVTGPGRVYVSVYNKTPKSISQSPFSVYFSPNTAIPPMDSIAPPLQFVATSTGYYCTNAQTISYYLEPCAGIVQRRYYIQVQNNSYNEPNVQVEVGVRFEPAPPAYVLFDHYSEANQINGNPTVENVAPYTPMSISSGTYTGYMGNLNCATKDAPDQNTCGTKTLWYAFDVASTGQIRINYDRPAPNGTTFDPQDLILLREVIPGDSSSSGLQKIPLSSINYNNNPDYNPGTNYLWGQACVFPGRYYIMFTGCRFPTETVIPRIWMVPQVGDLCSAPLTVTVPNGGGSFTSNANITCHTIGEGPGEDGSNMGCLGTPVGMKTHWFKIDLNGSVKYNLDIELEENTNATSSDIRYRIGYGDCNYMTFDNCVAEGLHIILNLKCRLPGAFYIQVLIPDWTTGDITLNLTATQVTDSNCTPIDPEKPRASFTYNASCVDTAVYFFNYSSIGTGITYFWDFGDSSSSTQFEPIHQYADTGTYLVTLIVDNTFYRDTIQQYVTVYPVPGASFAVADTVIAGAPITFDNTSTDTLPGALYYWDFCSSGTGSPCGANIPFYFGADPPQVTYNQGGWKYVCLTVTTGNCDSTFCKWVYVAYDNIFTGGPFDGNDVDAVYQNCVTNIFVGGPYDGAANDAVYSNCVTNIFVGGPYDGFAQDAVYQNCITNIFVGGPYDGFANNAVYSNCVTNIFAGGPYDGFANDAVYSNCVTNIFAGGPYDGFAQDKIISNCTPSSWFTGGPFDGAAVASVFAGCVVPDTNIFAGGPFDGASDNAVFANCVTNIFAGGPYDGFANDAVYSNCITNIFVGGPYDGAAQDAVYTNCTTNIFAGGPYDGNDVDAVYSNCTTNIFVGGPFDGNDVDAVYANCLTNIFVGGPFDGFGRSTARAFCEIPVFVGGPFDGHAVASFNSYQTQGDTVCYGQSATVTTNSPTDWYNVPTGGTAIATGTTTYTTPPLTQTSIYYAQNLCAGGRNPVIVQVNQLLSPSFNHATACVGEPMQFFNQTIVTTNPTASIGGALADISFLGTTGAPAPTGGITFSSQQVLNYGYLRDNLNNNTAWQSANASSPGTEWVQWNYVSPRSVTRFYYWNDPTQPNRAPRQLRLYYADGGPWILVKVIIPPYPSGGVFDTGTIPETNGIFARRWKLEVDVDANGPMWREFQVFSGTPGLGGNLAWDFGDGGTSTVQNPVHTYAGTGPYTVTLTVNNNGCMNTFVENITPCDAPLPITKNFLTAHFRPESKDVQLDWKVDGTFVNASIEKFEGSYWTALDTFDFDQDPYIYNRFDVKPWYNANNLYRVKYTDVDGTVHWSNIAEVWIDQVAEQLLLYPNPVDNSDLHIQWSGRVAGNAKWAILNQLGQTIMDNEWTVETGENQLTIPMKKLAAGVYYFRLVYSEGEISQKFVVVGK